MAVRKVIPDLHSRGSRDETDSDTFSGIVSALYFVPDYSGTYAAGTYAGTVTLYSEDTGGTPTQHVGGIKGGGVTQVNSLPRGSFAMASQD